MSRKNFARHSRLFKVVRNSIPYFPELRKSHESIKSVAATVLMQQLEYWFADHPNGFYKFLEPCRSEKYRQGDSWVEELAYTSDEFRAAFDCIGVRYRTKTEFTQSQDKFQGKFYCSFFDKRQGLTFYFRNHETVEALLDELIHGSSLETEIPISRDGNTHLPEWQSQSPETEIPISRDGNTHLPEWQSQSLETEIPISRDGNTHPAIYTETTSEITSETTPKTTAFPVKKESERGKSFLLKEETDESKPFLSCQQNQPINPQADQPNPEPPPVPLNPPLPPENKNHSRGIKNENHFQCDNSAFVGHGNVSPDGKSRPFNQITGKWASVSSDPWMRNQNPIFEFKEWVYRKAIAEGKVYSLSNASGEIRNNYQRAGDLWEEYQLDRQRREEADRLRQQQPHLYQQIASPPPPKPKIELTQEHQDFRAKLVTRSAELKTRTRRRRS